MTMATLQLMPRFLSKLKSREWLAKLLPAEWVSAVDVYAEIAALDAKRRAERVRSRVITLVMFLVGAVPSAILSLRLIGPDASVPGMVIGSIFAFSALVVGFVVTLMLFTGTAGRPETLSLEQLNRHSARILYLLQSQMTTLCSALAVSFFALVWLALFVFRADSLLLAVAGLMCGGMLTISLFRLFLLPLQIYELHSASLKDLIAVKASETTSRYTR
ncbi:hypothetical protein [Pseudomonas sp. CGJS7]|uniref:hypothetical protein n=1 Tax=Pseudomonas sp. CGJS7 TaxID=3109348 RepID=UPI00300AEE0C